MKTRRWIGVPLLLAMAGAAFMAGAALGREPDLRFDLATRTAFPAFVAVPFVFQDSGLDCPDARWSTASCRSKRSLSAAINRRRRGA